MEKEKSLKVVPDVPKKRKTRTKVDLSKLDPLDLKVYQLRQATRIVKIGRELDPESRALAIELLTKLDEG